jgi:hypothetical protein
MTFLAILPALMGEHDEAGAGGREELYLVLEGDGWI